MELQAIHTKGKLLRHCLAVRPRSKHKTLCAAGIISPLCYWGRRRIRCYGKVKF